MTYNTLLYDLSDNVATITLNRPDRMNALVPQLAEEMIAAMDYSVAKGARAIIFTGAGNAFCAGADLLPDSYGYEGMPEDVGSILANIYNPLVKKIAGLNIPVINAINGPAVGAGMGLALTGDIVMMGQSAYLQMAFVNIGLVPDMGCTWYVARSVGRAKTLDLALTGERISADAALAMGLVARVSADAELLADAQALGQKLAKGASVAVGLVRKQIATVLDCTFDEALEIESRNQTAASATEDFKEAIAAFGQKRKPEFKGQ